jgi:NADPH:quinone reductase-like Zn-dependent oxidoreductase
VELVRRLGADRVFDYTAGDFTRDDQTYDVVFDAVGKSSFGRCRQLLSRAGSISPRKGASLPDPDIHHAALWRQGVVFALPKLDQAMVRQLKGLIESGQFKPLIDRRYPLDQIVAAYRYVETGQKVGNVVISVGPPD